MQSLNKFILHPKFLQNMLSESLVFLSKSHCVCFNVCRFLLCVFLCIPSLVLGLLSGEYNLRFLFLH
jgi:hypothetical protein